MQPRGMHVKRWWGIRHVRWLWVGYLTYRWAGMCGECGLGLGYPNPSDLRTLDAIWKGER